MCLSSAAWADTLRVATYHVGLNRKGPGLLLRDILKREEQVMAVAQVIARNAPDVLLLTRFDHDTRMVAAHAFRDLLSEQEMHYPHLFARPPNSGVATGLDLDGDDRLGEAEDSQGYGAFTGQGGMLILSRLPIDQEAVRDFSSFLWRELPDHAMPPTMSQEVQARLRLSSVGHWVVPVETETGPVALLAFHAQTPAFDGPEDRNGRRNSDQIRFWQHYLDGEFGPPPKRFVLLGTFNVDPKDGDGRRDTLQALLADPRLQDPMPQSVGARAAASPGHLGDPALDTVDWKEPEPGNLRVDYALPSKGLSAVASGVDWPAPDGAGHDVVVEASPHRLVWIELEIGGS